MSQAKVTPPSSHRRLISQILEYLHDTASLSTLPGPEDLASQILTSYRRPFAKSKSLSSEADSIEKIKRDAAVCLKCQLGERRQKFVDFGDNPSATVLVLTDIPNYWDQIHGRLFSDRTGQLLEKILKSIDIRRDQVYMTAAIKCASSRELPGDLSPVEVCLYYLDRELIQIRPQMILGFGEVTYRTLFKRVEGFSEARGKWLTYKSYPLLLTHHPRDLLLDPSLKRETWEDLKKHLPVIAQKGHPDQTSQGL